ncbi:hypothetical protein DIURU_004538 [Diutina rugosa]|uniref:Zn(2)-C6 fungal-type domain-containing protein n=1 Tax=Diutina rugosa TaxID=5481 RepID=A0A642UGU7_DIURU|nr:uncharacterized protein DIURU_004538 [Diutina rugosa]KAA8898694.1 hypothetical protein DIURU_004538 [Diutina rugosa]
MEHHNMGAAPIGGSLPPAPLMNIPPNMSTLPNLSGHITSGPKKRVRRLPPDKRQKVSSACDRCRKAKHKCNGLQMCDRCTKKGLPCVYSMVDRRTLKGERVDRKRFKSEAEAVPPPAAATGIPAGVPPPPQPPAGVSPGTSAFIGAMGVSPLSAPTVPPSIPTLAHDPASVSSNGRSTDYSHGTSTSGGFPSPQHQSQSNSPQGDSPFSGVSNASTPASGNTSAPGQADQPSNKESIPKSLQPLLTFDEEDEVKAEDKEDLTITNQQGKCAIWLADSAGTYRYISETCPLSFLYDSRNIFCHFFGNSVYTDALKACPVLDKPYFNIEFKVPLPDRDDFKKYVEYFNINVNDIYYIFDDNYLVDELAESVYANPYHFTYEKITLYVVAGLGSLFMDFEQGKTESPKSADLFRTGVKLWQEYQDFDDFWLIRLNFLAHFYYSALCKKSTSWIYLNAAIRHAEALGLHRSFIAETYFSPLEVAHRNRVFRSLYIADRVLGSILGRPYAIADRDWDELPLIRARKVKAKSISESSQLELVRLMIIISQTVDNYYSGASIDLNRTRSLALELKHWALNLDERFEIKHLMKQPQLPEYSHVALIMHMFQLYAVMILARPFFIHELISELSGQESNKLACQFQEAAYKAALLTIDLIYYFNNVTQGANKFNETNVPTNVVFWAGLILGTQLLSKRMDSQLEQEISDGMKKSMQVLNRYGKTFKTAERYVEIMPYMAEHISLARTRPSKSQSSPSNSADLNWEFLDDLDFITDLNGDMSGLTEFQQGFVPSEFTTISPGHEGVSGPTDLPFNYPNYELLYGHKC